MKNRVFILNLLPLAILFLSWGLLTKKSIDFSYYSTQGLELYYDVPYEFKSTEIKIEFNPFLGKTYMGFREALAFKESRGDYFIVNDFGYMGKYQFGKSTLRMLGISDSNQFMNDPQMQEFAFKAYIARNKWELRNDIKRYNGKYVDGVYITESGILAAAHLAGPGNVRKFLRSGGEDVFTDGFGTSVRYYLRKFSGYDTSHIKPNKDAKVSYKG